MVEASVEESREAWPGTGGVESARYGIGKGRKGKEKAKASWIRKRGWRERDRFREESVQR